MKKINLLILILITVSYSQSNVDWIKIYNLQGSQIASSVEKSKDNGYFIAGYSWSDKSPYGDYLFMKTDSLGDTVWTKLSGKIYTDGINEIYPTIGDEYVAAGFYGSDIWLLKLTSSLDTIWTKTIRKNEYWEDAAYCVKQTRDRGFLMVGYTGFDEYDHQIPDILIIKTNEYGDTTWTRVLGSGRAFDFEITSDNEYIIVGQNDFRGFIAKIDSSGTLKRFNKIQTKYQSQFNSIKQVNEDDFILTGNIGSKAWLVKANSIGDTIWTKRYDFSTSAKDAFNLKDGFLLFSVKNKNLCVIQTNSLGDALWSKEEIVEGDAHVSSILPIANNTYIISGSTSDNYFLMKLSTSITALEPTDNLHPESAVLLQNYPNPFNPNTNISFYIENPSNIYLRIYDVSGKLVRTLVENKKINGQANVKWDGLNNFGLLVSSGIYIYNLKINNISVSKKMVLIR